MLHSSMFNISFVTCACYVGSDIRLLYNKIGRKLFFCEIHIVKLFQVYLSSVRDSCKTKVDVI